MSLFKKLFLLSFSLIAIFSVSLISFAGSTVGTNKTESADCFDYYKFQSVQVSVGPDQQTLKAGEPAVFLGELINENNYPVVDGYVFVRIGEKNPEYITEGQFVVDEFFALEKVSLNANEKKPISFTWTPPKNMKTGDYRADYFFSVGKKFNLGGLPFTNEVVIGFSDFSVKSNITAGIAFDKSATKVNGLKYNHIGMWPTFKEGEKVTINQAIKNTSVLKKTISVQYDLFYWDSLDEVDRIDSKKESVVLEAKSQKELLYIIPSVNRSVYYLRITALSSDGQKSIVNIRVASDLESPRINYPAINKFPLKAGEDFSLFSCYHNTSYIDTEGEVKVFLTDEKGKSLGELSYKGIISSDMSAQKVDLKALKDLFTVNLKAEVYNKAGVLVDKYETTYSCDGLNSDRCVRNNEPILDQSTILIVGALLLVAILLVIVFRRVVSNRVKIFIGIMIVIVVLLIATILALSLISSVDAQTFSVSADGKTKTRTDTYAYNVNRQYNSCRLLASGNVNYTRGVTLMGETNLDIGESVSFATTSPNCTYNQSYGAWDTPYCGTYFDYRDQNSSSGNPARINWTNPVAGSLSLTSSNPGVISCSGLNCQAVGSGTATVTASLSSASSNVQLCVYTRITDNGSKLWRCNFEPNWYNVAKDNLIYLGTGARTSTCTNQGNSYTFPAYSPSWTFTVASTTSQPPAPLSVTCSANPNPATLSGGTVSVVWSATSTGGSGTYTYAWNGKDMPSGNTWTYGNATSVPKIYGSTGTKYATTTVNDGTNVVSVGCPGTVTVGGGGNNGGGGVEVRNNNDASCGNKAGYYLSTDTIYRSDPACYTGTLAGSLPTFPQPGQSTSWICNGVDGGASATCTAYRDVAGITFDASLNCNTLEITNPLGVSSVNVNTTTSWEATFASSCPLCDRIWSVNGASTTTNKSNTLPDKIFTTIGLKTMSVQLASSTTIGNPCTKTVNVVQTGGGTREI